jgi:hypothetical protein
VLRARRPLLGHGDAERLHGLGPESVRRGVRCRARRRCATRGHGAEHRQDEYPRLGWPGA